MKKFLVLKSIYLKERLRVFENKSKKRKGFGRVEFCILKKVMKMWTKR